MYVVAMGIKNIWQRGEEKENGNKWDFGLVELFW
ncbi:hypothetical protein C5S53_04920 [Methanophagales archaeon]|nr:hypothetical protein C5S53_04920 [Methanophagales archaeon]